MAAAGPAQLLPGAGDGAGIAGEHRRLQRADIDSQLQGVGAHHAQDLALPQLPLDLPALLGQVSSPVSPDRLLGLPQAVEGLAQVGEEHLRIQAAAGKDNGGDLVGDELPGDPFRFQKRAAADAQGLVHHGGIVEEDVLAAPGRAVLVDHPHRPAQEPFPVLLGIGDGG